MKTLLALTLAAFCGILFSPPAHADDMRMSSPNKLIVFYADFCGQCKILEPKLEEALKTMDTKSFEQVKFNYTDRDTIMHSKEIAAEKGLTDLQKKYGAKTGFAVIANQEGQEIAFISANESVDEISATLQAATKEKM